MASESISTPKNRNIVDTDGPSDWMSDMVRFSLVLAAPEWGLDGAQTRGPRDAGRREGAEMQAAGGEMRPGGMAGSGKPKSKRGQITLHKKCAK